MNKTIKRLRRAAKTNAIQRFSDRPCLKVFKSNQHIYAQIIVRGNRGDEVIVSSSSIDNELSANLSGSKVDRAGQVGKLLGERAKAKDVSAVAFNRRGYKFTGRIKALAEAARTAGLNF